VGRVRDESVGVRGQTLLEAGLIHTSSKLLGWLTKSLSVGGSFEKSRRTASRGPSKCLYIMGGTYQNVAPRWKHSLGHREGSVPKLFLSAAAWSKGCHFTFLLHAALTAVGLAPIMLAKAQAQLGGLLSWLWTRSA